MDQQTKQKIKSELKREAERLINSQATKFRSNMSALEKIEMWQKKFSNTTVFMDKLNSKLNEIIKRDNIEIKNENEKNELVRFLKPTLEELIVKNIKK